MKRYLTTLATAFGQVVDFCSRFRSREINDAYLRRRVQNDVYCAIIEASERIDIGPEDLKPGHELRSRWLLGENGGSGRLLKNIQNTVLPSYTGDSGTRIPEDVFSGIQTVGECVDYVFSFVQNGNKP